MVGSEHEVARNFTWAILGMEDGIFWHLGGVARWNSQFLLHTWTFLAIIYVASRLFLCLFWINLWLKNRCLQHPCFKNLCKIAQASKNSDSNAQHFLSDWLTHSWFDSILFALLSYQFSYIVMNRCLYLISQIPPDTDAIFLWRLALLLAWFGLLRKLGYSRVSTSLLLHSAPSPSFDSTPKQTNLRLRSHTYPEKKTQAHTLLIRYPSKAMIRENRQFVTDEPVKFEK